MKIASILAVIVLVALLSCGPQLSGTFVMIANGDGTPLAKCNDPKDRISWVCTAGRVPSQLVFRSGNNVDVTRGGFTAAATYEINGADFRLKTGGMVEQAQTVRLEDGRDCIRFTQSMFLGIMCKNK
jgi:hypothetical protein